MNQVLLGVAGRRFFSDRVGLVAAFLLAVYPWAIFSDEARTMASHGG